MRFFRFRLLTLLATFVLVSLFTGALSHHFNKLSRALREVKQLGGSIAFAEPAGWSARMRPIMAYLYTEEVVLDVIEINFGGWQIDEEKQQLRDAQSSLRDLAEIDWSAFPVLRRLNLTGVPVDDSQLHHLNHLYNLKQLILDNTLVTEKGLAQLQELRSLKSISAIATNIDAREISKLRSAYPDCEFRVAHIEVEEPEQREQVGIGRLDLIAP